MILGNDDYSAIRWRPDDDRPDEKGYEDLPAVDQDMQDFRRYIQEYGFEDSNIMYEKNLDKAATKKTLAKLTKNTVANAKKKEKTLTVVYYGGHGMMRDN